jgi:hypothetical protein
MPLRWSRGANPYRLNYFGILKVGGHANPRVITSSRNDLTRIVGSGGEHRVMDREITEADLSEAATRLLDPVWRAAEMLLVHPRPGTDEGRLPDLCAAVEAAAAPPPAGRPLRLTDLTALVPLVPRLQLEDLPRPSWTELPVPGPASPQDLQADIQFDL